MPADPAARNPYVGLRTFATQDRDRFFGRGREASELLSLVTASPLVLLYSPSGAGKSSFLNAAVIPGLLREEFQVLPVARIRGPMLPGLEVDESQNIFVLNTLMSWDMRPGGRPELPATTLAGYLGQLERQVDPLGEPAPLVAIWDQFEELFTAYPEQWNRREEFFEQLAAAIQADPGLRVILSVREEYLAQLDPYLPLLPGRLRTRLRLERLNAGTARQVLTGPLAGTDRQFAPGVAELLIGELMKIRTVTPSGEVREVMGQYVETIQLQVVASTLWNDLPGDVREITAEHLQRFGDTDQALSNFYESAIRRAAEETGVAEIDLRDWFEDRLITPAGTRGLVFRGQEETAGLPNQAVDLLEQSYLIRAEFRAGARWYELIHDRLIEPIQAANRRWHSLQPGPRSSLANNTVFALVRRWLRVDDRRPGAGSRGNDRK